MGEMTSDDRLYLDDQLLELVLRGPVEEFLAELVEIAATTMSTPEIPVMCGVTVQRIKKARTTAASSEIARRLDELQSDVDEGPCLAALRESRTTVIQDTASERRWPTYVARASPEGMRSVCGVPLEAGEQTRASLNFYATQERFFHSKKIEKAELIATHAGRALRLALQVAYLTDTRADLTAAMESRTTIDVAVGMIMVQNRCSQESAMAMMKAASSHRNMKLRDIAQGIVNSVCPERNVSTFFDT